MTIVEAIKEAMRRNGQPMTAKEAYDSIIANGLYQFHTRSPAHVVQVQLRRHTEGIDSSTPIKHFQLVGEERFWPLEQVK